MHINIIAVIAATIRFWFRHQWTPHIILFIHKEERDRSVTWCSASQTQSVSVTSLSWLLVWGSTRLRRYCWKRLCTPVVDKTFLCLFKRRFWKFWMIKWTTRCSQISCSSICISISLVWMSHVCTPRMCDWYLQYMYNINTMISYWSLNWNVCKSFGIYFFPTQACLCGKHVSVSGTKKNESNLKIRLEMRNSQDSTGVVHHLFDEIQRASQCFLDIQEGNYHNPLIQKKHIIINTFVIIIFILMVDEYSHFSELAISCIKRSIEREQIKCCKKITLPRHELFLTTLNWFAHRRSSWWSNSRYGKLFLISLFSTYCLWLDASSHRSTSSSFWDGLIGSI